MPVKHVQLGEDGPEVAALGFGLMGLSFSVYGSISDDESRFAILDRAVELGATFWDSADLYGDSEELVGKWFKRTGKRNEIFLATKFGLKATASGYQIDSSAEYCKQCCRKSLERLGVDCIDLLYMHHANPETPIEETMRALMELREQGKIRYIGLSAISSSTLRRAVKIGPVAAVQVEYSPFVLDIENAAGTDLLKTCRELGVTLVASSPLGRGLLTSTFAGGQLIGDEKDMRSKSMPRFMEQNRDQNVKVVSEFEAMARKKGCNSTQLALAWLMKQGDDVIPIPGTKKMKYLEENWKALDVALTADEEAEVRRFLQTAELSGGYMPPGYEGHIFRDTAEEK